MDLWHSLPHNWLLPLLLVLLLQLQCASSDFPSQRCQRLKKSQLERMCNGRYPLDVKYNYDDKLVAHNDRFAIFSFNNEPDHYFFTFKSSELLSCYTLEILSPYEFACIMDNKESRILKINEGRMHCLDYHFQYADDLIMSCTYGQLPELSAFVVLHYANSNVTASTMFSSGRSLVAQSSMIYALAFAATMFAFNSMQVL